MLKDAFEAWGPNIFSVVERRQIELAEQWRWVMEQDLYQKGYEAGLAQGTVMGYRQHHAEMQPLMDEIIECLDDYADAEGPDPEGHSSCNTAMSLWSRLKEIF